MCLLLLLGVEHLVDRQVKEPRDPERQRQRRQVTAALDRDHRLPRDAQRRCQVSLGQPLLGALLPDPVPHEVKVALHERDVKQPLRSRGFNGSPQPRSRPGHPVTPCRRQLSGLCRLVTEDGRSLPWTPYRYAVYLHWMQQTASAAEAAPELLELTLFQPPTDLGDEHDAAE
jgi:hypothetical protein